MAGRWSGSTRIRLRRRGVPGARPHGNRRRWRCGGCGTRARGRADLVRRLAPHSRPHGDDQDAGRLRRDAPPPRLGRRQYGGRSRRGRDDRDDRPFGRRRARRSVRPSRNQAGGRPEGLHRPAEPAAAAAGLGHTGRCGAASRSRSSAAGPCTGAAEWRRGRDPQASADGARRTGRAAFRPQTGRPRGAVTTAGEVADRSQRPAGSSGTPTLEQATGSGRRAGASPTCPQHEVRDAAQCSCASDRDATFGPTEPRPGDRAACSRGLDRAPSVGPRRRCTACSGGRGAPRRSRGDPRRTARAATSRSRARATTTSPAASG